MAGVGGAALRSAPGGLVCRMANLTQNRYSNMQSHRTWSQITSPWPDHIWPILDRSLDPHTAIYGQYMYHNICRSYIGHIWAIQKLYISHVQLQYRPQMDHNEYEENGGRQLRRHNFLDIGYGPSVACTVGCTWLMYSLCMAHIWPMYDLCMAYMWPYVHIWQVLYIY